MRVMIEVEGAEISIALKEAGGKGPAGQTEVMLAQAVTGAPLDAGPAPEPSETPGPEARGAVTLATSAAPGDINAGPAPERAETGISPEAPMAAAMGGQEAIDAGAAKFSPAETGGNGGA